MTILNDPDEDAANLDDDELIEAYLDAEAPKAARSLAADGGAEIPEWPPLGLRDVGLTLDTATLAWFRDRHANWRREMGLVLRAWVTAQTRPSGSQTDASGSTVLCADHQLDLQQPTGLPR